MEKVEQFGAVVDDLESGPDPLRHQRQSRNQVDRFEVGLESSSHHAPGNDRTLIVAEREPAPSAADSHRE